MGNRLLCVGGGFVLGTGLYRLDTTQVIGGFLVSLVGIFL